MHDAHILSVTYEISLLSSRQAVLQSAGYSVQSASDLQDAVDLLAHRGFQLVVIGQDLPEYHQQALLAAAREMRCKTLLLTLSPSDKHLAADMNLDPQDGPYLLLDSVSQLLEVPGKRPTRGAAAAGNPWQNLA